MSSLVYQPFAMSFVCFSVLVTVFCLYLTKRSCEDMECGAAHIHAGNGWAIKLKGGLIYGGWHLEQMTNKGGGMVSFEKLHDSNSRAIFMWSPFFHWSCSHCGTWSLPPFFTSQSRLNLALRAFSSLVGWTWPGPPDGWQHSCTNTNINHVLGWKLKVITNNDGSRSISVWFKHVHIYQTIPKYVPKTFEMSLGSFLTFVAWSKSSSTEGPSASASDISSPVLAALLSSWLALPSNGLFLEQPCPPSLASAPPRSCMARPDSISPSWNILTMRAVTLADARAQEWHGKEGAREPQSMRNILIDDIYLLMTFNHVSKAH